MRPPKGSERRKRKTSSGKLTREGWLNRLVDQLCKPLFREQGYEIPRNLPLSCGWPSTGALARRNRRIGECWIPERSADATWEIFVSPRLDDHYEVAGTVVHEVVHAVVGCEAGHGKEFRRAAIAVGLTGSMRATELSRTLKERVHALFEPPDPFPRYPHAKLDGSPERKRQTNRHLKAYCPCCWICVCRVSATVARKAMPICPLCMIRLQLETPRDKSDWRTNGMRA